MKVVTLTIDELEDLLQRAGTIGGVKALECAKEKELEEKFLSVEETCKMFQPPITRQTLSNWADKNIVKKYLFGKAVFYKYTEIIKAAKHIKKFNREI